MSEENVESVESEIVESGAPAQVDSGKPAGYDPVDPRTATPEEIEQRLTYLYRQVKNNERTVKEYRGIAEQQSSKIEELMNGMGTVVNHLQDRSFSETESQLKEQLRAAFEAGDTAKYVDIQDKLDDMRLEKKLATRAPKAEPKTESKPAPQDYSEESIISKEENDFINEWQDETDENGNLLRPWAHNSSPDPRYASPDYHAAMIETQAVLQSPKFKGKSIEEKMAEVDRRMGLSKPARQNNVMGGQLTGSRKTNKITLSPRQQEIALRTVSTDGKKIKSDADKLEWYRQQLEKTSKGARK